jgi:hypothetical protein
MARPAFIRLEEITSMNQLTPEEERERIKGAPLGTFALMLLVGALLFGGWAFLFFYRFMQHGPVN